MPWTIYLGLTLPAHTRAAHYDLAWVGFDIGMLIVLAALAWAAFTGRPFVGEFASVAATFLVVDAWFDVVTAPHRAELMQAIASAVLLELPLAGVCIWVAVNAERIRMKAFGRIRAALGPALVRSIMERRAPDEPRP